MSPPELLLASLAACAAYCATQYLKTRMLSVENLKVRVSASKARQPARLASFRIDVEAPGLDERNENGVLRAVKACLIDNTLLGGPDIEISVNAAAFPAVPQASPGAIGTIVLGESLQSGVEPRLGTGNGN
ncbi:MAG: OsmC family protein [Bryobacteraceae bacterium]